jgi:heme A synthase
MPVARWMRRLAIAGVLLCFVVVVLGAYVRLTAAGLGCPDWPGCYGQLTPSAAQHSAEAQAQYAGRPLELGKAWREMLHRYAVGTLSGIILALVALALGARRQRLVSVPFALALLATLVLQALLGMLTVTWRLNPLIVTLHLLFGMTTLALLWWLTLSLPTSSWGTSAMRGPGRSVSGGGASPLSSAYRLTLFGLAALALQIALGGWTSSNYAAVACPDFPTCRGPGATRYRHLRYTRGTPVTRRVLEARRAHLTHHRRCDPRRGAPALNGRRAGVRGRAGRGRAGRARPAQSGLHALLGLSLARERTPQGGAVAAGDLRAAQTLSARS